MEKSKPPTNDEPAKLLGPQQQTQKLAAHKKERQNPEEEKTHTARL